MCFYFAFQSTFQIPKYMTTENHKTLKKIRLTIIGFMLILALSGISAIPVRTEINFLLGIIPREWMTVRQWLQQIAEQLSTCGEPLLYGFDWLAFAHIVLAINFIGVLKDPVRNIWIIEFAMISCLLIIPFTFIMAPVRGIPFWWQLIDCSFGVFGLIPLYLVRTWIQQLEKNNS